MSKSHKISGGSKSYVTDARHWVGNSVMGDCTGARVARGSPTSSPESPGEATRLLAGL